MKGNYLKYPDPPNTIKIELTEGCNLRCGMCGIQGIREKAGGPYKFLTPALASRLAIALSATGWNCKMECAMRGEPLMNPDAAEIFAVFRYHNPKMHIMVTSNALALLKKPGVDANLDMLFNAGVNTLALDAYRPSMKAIEQVRQNKKYKIQDYEQASAEKEASPYQKMSVSTQRIVIMEDFETACLNGEALGVKHVNNHCGAGMPALKEPLDKRCSRPFREMVIRHDGHLTLCCNDWRGELYLGHVLDDYGSFEEAWSCNVMMSARKALYHSDRGFAPCEKCNERTYRNGLLPDKRGLEELPKPKKTDWVRLDDAHAKGPMTKPVFRPWEG